MICSVFLLFVSFSGTCGSGFASCLRGVLARWGTCHGVLFAKPALLPRFFRVLPATSEPAMSPASSNSQLDQLHQLLSAQHDGQLTAAEQQQLQHLSAQFPQQARQFQADLAQVSVGLRGLPRQALAGPIFSAETSAQVPWLVRPSDSSGRRWAKFTAVVSTLAVLGLLVMFTRQAPDSNSAVSRSDTAVQTDSAAAANRAAEFESLLPRDSAPAVSEALPAVAASPAEPVMAAQPAAAESLARFNESAAVSNPQVQLLADAADWKVVVVKVGAVDRSDVKDRVGKVLQQHGLLLADAASVAMPEWLAVVLSTDALVQQSLVQAVSVAVDGKVSEWNPAGIRSAAREEIVAAVRRSLQSPTQAELARGEIYVAVRGVPAFLAADGLSNSSAEEQARLGNRVDFYNGLNGATGRAAEAKQLQAAAKPPARSGAKAADQQQLAESAAPVSGGNVTLLVFEFPDSDAPQENSDGADATDKDPNVQ